jgi:hypothetical protein
MPWNEVMDKFRAHRLKSSSGQPVTNPKQAVAIEYSEKKAAEGGKEEYQSHPAMKLKQRSRKAGV